MKPKVTNLVGSLATIILSFLIFGSTAMANFEIVPDEGSGKWLSKISTQSLESLIKHCQKSFSMTSLQLNLNADGMMEETIEKLRSSYVDFKSQAVVTNPIEFGSVEEFALESTTDGSLGVTQFFQLYYAARLLDLKDSKVPSAIATCQSLNNMGVDQERLRTSVNVSRESGSQLGLYILHALRGGSGLSLLGK